MLRLFDNRSDMSKGYKVEYATNRAYRAYPKRDNKQIRSHR